MATFNSLVRGGVTAPSEWSDEGKLSFALVQSVKAESEKSLGKAREIVAGFSDTPGSVVDELIADRRAENAREVAEEAEWHARRSRELNPL